MEVAIVRAIAKNLVIGVAMVFFSCLAFGALVINVSSSP
jgi:hypothetical protein